MAVKFRLPSAPIIFNVGTSVLRNLLIGAITVYAGYEIAAEIDCHEQIRQCRDKYVNDISEEGGRFDASDIRRCVRKCLELLGDRCHENY
jgi:hypothetical protein